MPRQRVHGTTRPDIWARPARARQPLTRDAVVHAALELLDEVGLDGLTMRRLAARLRVQSPSLYWHVRDKNELLTLLADAICAEIKPPGTGQPWPALLDAMAWEYRRVLLAHRDGALVLANTPPVGPNRLHLAERMLRLLLEAGIARAIAARAGLLLTDFVTNAVIEEGRVQDMIAAASADEAGGGTRDSLASLPANEYPTLVALAADLTDADVEARFRFGLEVLVAGLLAKNANASGHTQAQRAVGPPVRDSRK